MPPAWHPLLLLLLQAAAIELWASDLRDEEELRFLQHDQPDTMRKVASIEVRCGQR